MTFSVWKSACRILLFGFCFSLFLFWPAVESQGAANTEQFSLKARGAHFWPSETSARKIYKSGWMGEGEINARILSFVELWFIGNYYSSKGKLPFTGEATRMTLVGLGGGIKFRARIGAFNPYLGFGPLVYFYKERNPIGTAEGNKVGYIGQLGCHVVIAGGFLLDLSVSYTHCKVQPHKIKADLGGIYGGLGLGFTF